MRRTAVALLTFCLSLSLCGFAHFGGAQTKIAVLTPGTNFPQSPDSTHPSASRWADDFSAATRQTQYGSSSNAGYNDNVVAAWSNPIPWSLVPSTGNYTLNGVAGVLVCAHAQHISNVTGHRLVDSFAVDGGAWVTTGTITEKTSNPVTGVMGDACSFTPMSALADGEHEWRFRSCPVNGAGICAELSSVKNVSENYAPAPSGTLQSVAASAITGGTLVSGAESITYTNLLARGFAITAVSYNSSTHIEKVTFNYQNAPTQFYFTLGSPIVVQGLTGTGNWNNPAGVVTAVYNGTSTVSLLGCTTQCTVEFNNAAGAPSGTITCPCTGATISNYADALVPGQQIIVSGVTPSSYNATVGQDATVATSYCTAPGAPGVTGNCVATFTNGSSTASYVSGGLVTTPTAVFMDPGQHRVAATAPAMVAITGSSDANIPNYAVSGTAASNTGVYCLSGYLAGHPAQVATTTATGSATTGKNAFNPGSMQLYPALFSSSTWSWGCANPAGTITGISATTTTQGSVAETVTYTDATNWPYSAGDVATVVATTPVVSASSSGTCPGAGCTETVNYTSSSGSSGIIAGQLMTLTAITSSVSGTWNISNAAVLASPAPGCTGSGSGQCSFTVANTLLNGTYTNGGTVTAPGLEPTNGLLTAPSSCVAGSCTATMLSPNAVGGWFPSGTNITFAQSTSVISDGLGENMTVTDFGAGGNTYLNAATTRTETVTQGSLFAWTNAGGAIKSVTNYVDSVAGLNNAVAPPFPANNCQNPAAPCQTLDVAAASMTNTQFLGQLVQTPTNQAVTGCLIFTASPTPGNNTSGGVPLTVGPPYTPFAFRGKNGTMVGSGAATMILNQSYWASLVTGTNGFTIAEYPGGPCITDALTVYSSVGVMEVTADLSFDTAVLECTVPANCPFGSPEQFWWGPAAIYTQTAPGGWFSYTNLYISPNTQLVGGNTADFGYRWHFIGHNSYTPDIGPQSYTFTSTGDIPPLANVGPANPTTYMTGYPAPTPVTSGSAVVGTSVTLNYTDPADKTFQTYVNGGNTYGNILIVSGITGDTTWNCTGSLPTGVSPPTNCYVINQGCTAGACFVTYANSAVATTGATVTSALVLIQTIDMPVNVPAVAGCTAQPCVPPDNISYRTGVTVPTGVAPVGPGNGFVVYATGSSVNTSMVPSAQNCMSFTSGESGPGMGATPGGLVDIGPPGAVTWISSLDVSGGSVQHLILSANHAATYGFLNWADCPAGTPFSFANDAFTVLNLGSPDEIWYDHVNAYSPDTYNTLSVTDGAVYSTNSSFNALTPTGNAMALMQNSVMANNEVCWSSFYVVENSICSGLGVVGPYVPALQVADPTMPPLSPIFGHQVIAQANGYGVTASPNLNSVITGSTATPGSPGSITLNYTSATSYTYPVGQPIIVSGVVSSASNWNTNGYGKVVSASGCTGTACYVTYPQTVTTSNWTRNGLISSPQTYVLQMRAAVPAGMAIGWNGTITCQDQGNTWSEDLWVTGYNFAASTVSFGSNSGENGAGVTGLTAIIIPSSCVQAVVLWDAGIHDDFNFTDLGNAPDAAGVNFPSQIFVNDQSINDTGLWIYQAGGPGSQIDNDYEYNNFALDTINADTGSDIILGVPLINSVFLHNSWTRGLSSWKFNPWNIDVFMVNSVPNYQLVANGVSLPGGAGTSVETVTYNDSTNTVQPVGEVISVLGTAAYNTFDSSNNTTWGAQVLASPPPSCNGSGVCQLSFNNPYSPTANVTTAGAGVLQIPTINPPTYGAEGCLYGAQWSTSPPSGTKIWPAWNGGNWSGSGGLNDLTPWYALPTGVGPGSC